MTLMSCPTSEQSSLEEAVAAEEVCVSPLQCCCCLQLCFVNLFLFHGHLLLQLISRPLPAASSLFLPISFICKVCILNRSQAVHSLMQPSLGKKKKKNVLLCPFVQAGTQVRSGEPLQPGHADRVKAATNQECEGLRALLSTTAPFWVTSTPQPQSQAGSA